jgi:hypothetical protein
MIDERHANRQGAIGRNTDGVILDGVQPRGSVVTDEIDRRNCNLASN